VLLVAPPTADAKAGREEEIDARLEAALIAHSLRDAADVVAAETGQPRRKVYARALKLIADRGG